MRVEKRVIEGRSLILTQITRALGIGEEEKSQAKAGGVDHAHIPTPNLDLGPDLLRFH
jgi:hypothetical protein